MTDRRIHPLPTQTQPTPISSDLEATRTLDDAPYIAYALIQAFKLFTALVSKRWPQLR